MLMDDNHFLIEWLAYHYHVMPLRRLIVLVDPNSKTTPEPILNRWRDRMDITIWFEKDIFPRGIPPPNNRSIRAAFAVKAKPMDPILEDDPIEQFEEEDAGFL